MTADSEQGPPPLEPAPSKPSRWRRLWHRLHGLVRPGAPYAAWTVREAEVGRERDRLRAALADRDDRILALSTRVRELESTVKVQDTEIKLLAGVCARNHARVQAEMAVHARTTADATEPPPA